MRRRPYVVLALLLSVLVVAGPGSAHDKTGSEEVKTRRGTTYTNNVKCARGETFDAQGVKIYRWQSGTSGGIGTCNEGKGTLGSKVIQGRAVASGDFTKGGSVYADGDRNNTQNERLTGWARVDGGTSGVKVRCGDDKGRRDATHATAADGQEDCQG
jgi:hypothetical protein